MTELPGRRNRDGIETHFRLISLIIYVIFVYLPLEAIFISKMNEGSTVLSWNMILEGDSPFELLYTCLLVRYTVKRLSTGPFTLPSIAYLQIRQTA